MATNTKSLWIQLTLSSNVGPSPPYNVSAVAGTITYDDNTTASFNGWNAETLLPPIPSGADFAMVVIDTAGVVNASSVQAWSLTFLPRPGTAQQSPFGNNINTITGGAIAGTQSSSGWMFGLVPGGNYKIKNGGNWDWMVIVQVASGGNVYAFASDPEMEVGT